MPIKLNGATNGSVELNVPAAVGSDLQLTLPAVAGEVVVKATDGSVDLGSVDIDSSGNVGIGTSTPSSPLTVDQVNGNVNLELHSSSSGRGTQIKTHNDHATFFHGLSGDTAGDYLYYTADAKNHVFSTSNVERLRIDSSGRVGIGTSSPLAKLHIGAATGGIRFGISGATPKANVQYTASGAEFLDLSVQGTTTGHGNIRFYTGPTPDERMRIDSSGNVGIGTSSVNNSYGTNVNIHNTATSGARLKISDGTSGNGNIDGLDIIHQSGIAYIAQRENNDIRISTNNEERMRIDSSGNVLIGTTSVGGSGGTTLRANGLIAAPAVYSVGLSASPRDAYIDQNGEFGYVPSIREAKTNIQVQNDVDWLYQLKPVTFNYKTKDRETGEYTGEAESELEYGLIAEDVETACPDLCFYDQTDNGPELRGVSYKKLITPMIKALQDAQAKIETLETKVATLEATS